MGTGCAAGAVGIVKRMTAEAPIDTTSNGAVPPRNASDNSHVMAIPSAVPIAPMEASLLLLLGDGKSLMRVFLLGAAKVF